MSTSSGSGTATELAEASAPALSKGYEPQGVETRWYAQWQQDGCFHADETSDKPPFSIVIPPPNITGVLTMGHVLNNTIQDILARRARLAGKEVLWLPGTDHAGLATQTAVEKFLRKSEGKTRADLGREAFLERVVQWQDKHGGIIIQQLQKLGCSCDWQRQRYTMDAGYSRDVLEAFVALYNKGCIRRGKRMVNWCPGSLTAISDEEVIPKSQNGAMYYMRYELADAPGEFIDIATTRPETLMGDSAVAVKPGGKWARYIGKEVWRPFPKERIPVIGDEMVDEAFGTGALKVTPAHDRTDFEIGERHKLPAIDVLYPNGKINCPAVPDLHGVERFEARKLAAEKLKELGLLVKEEPYQNNVGFSERADVPIEPRLSEQWFLDYRKMLGGEMIEESLRVVREGLIRFFPAHWQKTYEHWLENIQPWCVSRQVWWGHRIPVWYRGPREDGSFEETRCQLDSPGADWQQDEDTLDTWASSWLWAYATMNEATRKKFYPTSVLVTGPDIIFLWVARMIIAGLEFKPGADASAEANIPFKDVYYTGIIRDKQGRKMSKSLGNSPDPLDLIAQYGADGLRFGLMRIAPQGQDIRFEEQQPVEGRNFCNKLWNAARFRLMHGPVDGAAAPKPETLTPFARALLTRLNRTIAAVDTAYEEYRFNEIAQQLHDFVWGDFCDWFIEGVKAELAPTADAARRESTLAVMDYVLSRVVRLLHPYAPFITEELWHSLPLGTGSVQFAGWPKADAQYNFADDERRVAALYESISRARALRAENGIPSNKRVPWLFKPAADAAWLRGELETVRVLLNAERIDLCDAAPPRTPVVVTEAGEFYLPLDGLIDVEAEKQRLSKEIAKTEKDLAGTVAKLANPDFAAKVPAAVLEEHQQRKEKFTARIEQLKERLAAL